MTEATKFTKDNSTVVSLRVFKADKKRIDLAAKKTDQAPGVFMRVGVLNEVEYVEKQ